MTVSLTTDALVDLSADVLALFVPADPSAPVLDALEAALSVPLAAAAADLNDTPGHRRTLYPGDAIAAERVALVSLGTAEDVEADTLRQAGEGAAKAAQDAEGSTLALVLPAADLSDATTAQALTEGVVLGSYRYVRYKTDASPRSLSALQLHPGAHPGERRSSDAVAAGAERGHALARAACTARDLVNCSPHDKTATLFAQEIQDSGAAHGYDVETWTEERIRTEGFGGLLAVNQGSIEPPTFSLLSWTPDHPVNDDPIVLVGKGVVYDTGGLSLKKTKGSMELMKSDMGGAAAVVGAFEAVADLDLPLHIIGLIPATDNRPGQTAYVPGDVVRMHSGATVEVLNTDAEGRMLLADALSYARQYDPELVIDLATLTGSQVAALGHEAAAVMTSETDGASERLYALQRAGERSGERVHPLPMYEDYREYLDSDVADIKNVGGRAAGAITAGKFLEHFVDVPWLHLDIAGPAFLQSAKPYRPPGGTGFGVRLLATFLTDWARAQQTAPER